MEERQYDVRSVKDRLNEFREGEREIENQTEALERLKSKMEGIGAQVISDMPRSPSPPSDRVTDLVYRKMELEEEIGEIIAKQNEERQAIRSILKKISSADERAVIRFRYLLGMSWYDVSDAMFGGQVDYLGKEDVYLRRVYRLHGQALVHIAEKLEPRKST